jgi:hypothetical protein
MPSLSTALPASALDRQGSHYKPYCNCQMQHSMLNSSLSPSLVKSQAGYALIQGAN